MSRVLDLHLFPLSLPSPPPLLLRNCNSGMQEDLSSLNKNNRPVGLTVLLPPGHHPVRAAKFRTSLIQRHRESRAATTQEET